MGMKGFFFIFIGFCIDALQWAVAWACFALGAGLQAVTPAGGALGGAAAAAAVCYSTANGGIISGITEGIKCAAKGGTLGAIASAIGMPLGMALSIALTICISLTLGSALIILLALNGMFYPVRILGAFIGKIMPGLDLLPTWTGLALSCVLKKAGEESSIAGAAVGVAGAVISPASASGKLIGAARSIERNKNATGVARVGGVGYALTGAPEISRQPLQDIRVKGPQRRARTTGAPMPTAPYAPTQAI